ncbi:uncharacterized protein LOC127594539 [Hippocampus zosterae]|uniref:uncharacterized protein LOC127594539 n=1 Tax=Hippocampus zosterae TaxID=109293 RepID=UPI00223D6794|nr:uncharacterized protein LOC127594539 [Hippocampus zosterae]
MGSTPKADSLTSSTQDFFGLSARTIDGQVVEFGHLRRARLVLVVNIASKSPLAPRHFASLVRLYQAYESQIETFILANFKVRFILLEKAEVNGPNPHPVYAYLRMNGPLYSKRTRTCRQLPGDFTYFMVDPTGRVIAMVEPSTPTGAFDRYIRKVLAR